MFWQDVWTAVTSSISRRQRNVQDANQWLTDVSKPEKMPLQAILPPASDFRSAMTSNYVRMTRKVPQTDSTDPRTLTPSVRLNSLVPARRSTLGSRSRHWASMRPPASRAQLLFAFPATKMPNQPKLTPRCCFRFCWGSSRRRRMGWWRWRWNRRWKQDRTTWPGQAFSCVACSLYIKEGCQLAIVTPAHCLLRRERHLHNRQNGEREKQTNKQLVKAHIYDIDRPMFFWFLNNFVFLREKGCASWTDFPTPITFETTFLLSKFKWHWPEFFGGGITAASSFSVLAMTQK